MSETITLRAPPPVSILALVLAGQAVLQLLDLATTFLALQEGAVEANPVSRAMIEDGGWWVYGAVKVLLAAAFVAILPLTRDLRGGERRFVLASMGIFAALMLAVVVNNALILL